MFFLLIVVVSPFSNLHCSLFFHSHFEGICLDLNRAPLPTSQLVFYDLKAEKCLYSVRQKGRNVRLVSLLPDLVRVQVSAGLNLHHTRSLPYGPAETSIPAITVFWWVDLLNECDMLKPAPPATFLCTSNYFLE